MQGGTTPSYRTNYPAITNPVKDGPKMSGKDIYVSSFTQSDINRYICKFYSWKNISYICVVVFVKKKKKKKTATREKKV